MEGNTRKMIDLARELAGQHTDAGLNKAAEIMLHLIETGHEDPEILIYAAMYLLQGPRGGSSETRNQALAMVDKATASMPENITLLKNAVFCYEMAIGDFPDKIDDIIRLCLKILDIDPDNVEAMITLACHRNHPGVALDYGDAIRMLEWAKEIEPDNMLVYFTLARLHMEAGHYKQARQIYRQIITHTESYSRDSLNARHQLKSIRPKSKYKRLRKYGVN